MGFIIYNLFLFTIIGSAIAIFKLTMAGLLISFGVFLANFIVGICVLDEIDDADHRLREWCFMAPWWLYHIVVSLWPIVAFMWLRKGNRK